MQRRACPPAENCRTRPLREGDRDAVGLRSHLIHRGLRGCAETPTGWNAIWLLDIGGFGNHKQWRAASREVSQPRHDSFGRRTVGSCILAGDPYRTTSYTTAGGDAGRMSPSPNYGEVLSQADAPACPDAFYGTPAWRDGRNLRHHGTARNACLIFDRRAHRQSGARTGYCQLSGRSSGHCCAPWRTRRTLIVSPVAR